MKGSKIRCKNGFTISADTGKTICINKDDVLWITTSNGYFDLKKKMKIARLSQTKCGIGWDITKSQLEEHFEMIG